MLRKNQLKCLSLQKLWQYAQSQTNSQTLTLIKQIIDQRNQTLNQKLKNNKVQLNKTRIETKKTIKQMNIVVRDILQKKQKIVMDKNSRPTQEDIKNLTQLYGYMENQAQLIDRNNKDIQKVLESKINQLNKLKNKQGQSIQIERLLNPQEQFRKFDQEFLRLDKECEIELGKLENKHRQFHQFKLQLQNINSSIQKHRIQYEKVQNSICQRERQLDHLVTYLKNRIKEDQENIQRQNQLTYLLENQLLKAQNIYNFNHGKNQQLKIKEIQVRQKQPILKIKAN